MLSSLVESLLLDHLPRDLHQLMRGAESPLAHLAEHLREFKQTWFAIESLDTCQGAVALNQFLHLIMFIAKRGELRKMSYAKHLMRARKIIKFLSHHHSHAPTDALINFVENQGGNFIGLCKYVFQSQH